MARNSNPSHPSTKIALTLILLLNCLFAAAQYPAVFFNNLGLNQGLSQSCVTDITFDSKGFVWLATQDGLNRYDGKDFLVLDKKFDDITSGISARLGKIAGDGNSLWIISKGGYLEQLDLATGNFRHVNISTQHINQVISCIQLAGDGKMWIGTASGKVILFDEKANKVLLTLSIDKTLNPSPVNALFVDDQQRLWVLGNTLSYIQNNQLHRPEIGIKTAKNEVGYSCLTEDTNGTYWLGSWGGGLFVKTKSDSVFRQFKGYGAASLPSDLVIESILADHTGKIWMGTYGKGLFIIDNHQHSIQQLVNDKRNPSSLPFNDVLSIKQDANKGIWIGTDGGGLSYFNENRDNFVLFNNQTVPPDAEIALIRSIVTDKNSDIWVGTTDKGLTEMNYQKGIFKTFHFPSYKKNIYNPDRIVSLFNDKDNLLWIGTQGNGLILFDPEKGQTIKWFRPEANQGLAIPDGTVWCMQRYNDNSVWAGTESSGLCLIDKRTGLLGSYKPKTAAGELNDAVRAIAAINDSTLAIGFEKSGIRLFNTGTKTFYPGVPKSLAALFNTETTIKSLYYNWPVLWIGTGGRGIMSYNIASGATAQFTDKDGLPNNTVYGILPDNNGHLWLSTNKGLSSFNPVAGGKGSPSFTNYTAEQGLQSNEFNTGAYYKTPAGMLLFGGINGLNLFDPTQFKVENKQIPVVFTNIIVDNAALLHKTSAPFIQHIALSYKNNSVAFNFVAPDFFSSLEFHYYYKLNGYDKDWIDANQRNYVSYTNIPTGHYDFMVKYIKPGNTNLGMASRISIDIKGPFWKKTWFMVSAFFAFLAFVYLVYRYRIAQIYKLSQIRQRIATDLHDDIGSTLSNINILSALSKKNLKNPDQANEFLNRISEEVEASSQSLDDIIWSINSRNDNWEETFSRMRRYADEVFENSKIRYSIKFDEHTGTAKLKMEKRRDIFLIYKELINNIHKHAQATEVEITMLLGDGKLVMRISDNGIGFDKNSPTHRNGLKNLRSRVDRWRGDLFIDTGPAGTTIKILI